MKLTETTIQHAIWERVRDGAKVALPNYTPPGWAEADVWVISHAGLATEYEVKISAGDFRADSAKIVAARRKHDLLASRSSVGPSRFFYVVPEALVTKIELPSWAGLLTVREWRGIYAPHSGLIVSEVKRAPWLHKSAVPEPRITAMWKAAYWRFWNRQTRLAAEVARVAKREGPAQ